jgi:hypothetical protein
MIINNKMGGKPSYILAALCIFLFSACASAPVQEMSDARQAIYAARSVPTNSIEPSLLRAEKYLRLAEKALHVGDYRDARENAKLAREHALQAQKALASRANY